ncbi:MAG TPA: hypothetical protein VMI13_07330 [Solirubrobacteraceae bacterium]|nr:hypothetical protein [Solirubrobacteraceae bacterium]
MVFVAYREVARPMGGEGHLERHQAQVSLWVEGRIARLTSYADVEDARAAATAARAAISRGSGPRR